MMGVEEARTTFSAAHFIYIPLCVLAGVILGWLLGSRSTRAEVLQLRQLLDQEERQQATQRMRDSY